MQIMDFVQTSYPMRPVEIYFREKYLAFPERHLELPSERSQICDILSGAGALNDYIAGGPDFMAELDESAFIHDHLDAALYIHYRFMPCMLHTHSFFEMMYVEQGECVNYIEGRPVFMKKGDVSILAPGVTHAIGTYDENTILINSLIRSSTFNTTFISLLEDDSIIANFFYRALYHSGDKPYLIFHTGDDTQISGFLHIMLKELAENRRYRRQMINNVLSALFITLIRDHEQDMEIPTADIRSDEDNLLYIIHYMQNHYTSITLQELSAFFNYSERQMQRVLKNATGMSFMENIQHQKISRAKDLLENSELTIEEICELTGFQSENNFRRIFRRSCGMNPGEYRIMKKARGVL